MPPDLRTRRLRFLLSHGILLCAATACIAQADPPAAPVPNVPGGIPAAPDTPPVSITLQEAIRRAQANEPTFANAVAERGIARADRNIARSNLLPGVAYHNQAIYTQPSTTGVPPSAQSPIFIANNGVHEYASQAVINETIGLKGIADLRAANANAASAAAEMEVARRGLVAAVVGLYYGVAAEQGRLTVAQSALGEANTFLDQTGKREQAREVAHADSVKAQLQQQQRSRDLADAQLAADKARLELGVLLFPDPRTAFTIVSNSALAPLPTRAQVEAQAAGNSAELKSAFASLHLSEAQLASARAGYLPDLSFNFGYGIDAPQFAVNGPDKTRNLGYAASATIDIPIWDWLATQQRVKQGQLHRDAARVALSSAQRRLIADLDEDYAETTAAREQLASLNDSVDTATESLRLTKLRYTNGESNILEVVDAQSALVTAENAREDGVVRYQQAIANLQTLTGTL